MFRFKITVYGQDLMIWFNDKIQGSSLYIMFNFNIFRYNIWPRFRDKF
jgi:hypothetical protein